jgi:hypothetical protein
MEPSAEPPQPKHWWDIDPPLWLGLLLCAALMAVLVLGPIALAKYVHPLAGVAGALIALPAWLYLGPRPMPGLLGGFLCIQGFVLLLTMLAQAALDALRGGSAP